MDKLHSSMIGVLILVVFCVYATGERVHYARILQNAHLTKLRAQNIYGNSHELEQTSPQLFLGQNDFNDVLSRAENILASEFGANGSSIYDVSSTCLNHTKLFLEALVERQLWALKMIDAMGKPASGLLTFNIKWVGSWEECRSVEAVTYSVIDGTVKGTHQFDGKYCFASIPIGTQVSITGPVALSIGICVPDSCNTSDTAALANTLISLLPLNQTTLPRAIATCQENSMELSGKAIFVITVCSVFLVVIVSATLYDIVLYYLRRRRHAGYERMREKTEYGSFNGHVANGTVLAVTDTNGQAPNGHVIVETTETTPLNNSHKTDSAFCRPDRHATKSREVDGYGKGTLSRILLSFSVFSNVPKILNTTQPAGSLTAVNGIRFISMTWVILGHTYAFGVLLVENVGTFFPEMIKRFTFQAIDNATVSVDTFFVLSGLLVAYLSLREMKKTEGVRKFKWSMFYFHRFWRLTPPYMLLLMLYVPTAKYWSDGPFWPQSTGFDVDECKDTWWTNLLYINNLVRTDKMCMGWSWYLANDMQFYVLSPLMLIPLYYSPLWGTVSCLALILVNFISAGVISKHYTLESNFLFDQNVQDAMQQVYFKPWTRIGPYVVGFFTGYLLYITECKVKMPKIVNIVGWIVATALALLVLYGLYNKDGKSDLSVDVSALYNATSRTVWGVSVAWVIFACATGYGGPVNALLSWRPIIPLSRLTYCAYLVHPLVMYVYYYSRRTLMYWYDLEVIYLFLGHLCLSYAAAFVLSLAFESPMMGLEKVLLGRKKNS